MLTKVAKWYLNLYPVTPPDYYLIRKPLERARMEFADENTNDGFHQLLKLSLADKDVLDLGCGFGGRTTYYKMMGARSVVGLEVSAHMVEEALAFAEEKGVQINAMVGVGENLPLPSDHFDVITSYDVFEHVASLRETLLECYRVLKPGGVLCAAFPPFYHPTGGSHLHGYISRSPAPNLLFSCKTLRAAIEAAQMDRGIQYKPNRRPRDPLPTVNGTTVSSFRRLLEEIPFANKSVTLDPLVSRRYWWLNWVPRIWVRLPFLREVATNRIMCVLTK